MLPEKGVPSAVVWTVRRWVSVSDAEMVPDIEICFTPYDTGMFLVSWGQISSSWV